MRVYGGFYGTSEQDAHQAQAYADMMGGTPTLYDVKIKPGTKVLHKQGDITRLSESYINELVSQGYGVVTGTDPRGQTEHVVIDKSAVASMAPRGAQATPSQVNDINVADMRQPSDQPAKNVSADTVPAPSATAGEASQLVPAIDTGYREVIPGNQPQVEVSNEPVTPIPAISSERSGDQPGAGEPAAAGAGPAVAGLTDRAGSGDRADLAAPAPVPDGQQQNDPTLTAPATDAGAAVSGRIGEEELRDRDLLKEHGGHWKYRSAVGAGWFTANTKEAAIERAEEAYRKAVSKGEPVPTRDERFAQADAELFSEMDRRYGKMSTPELEAEYQRLGGEVGDLQKSGSGEFNGNGGRRTGAAVSNEGARQVGEERLRLGVYMKMRRDRDTAGSGAKSQQIEPANDWRGAKSATDYHAAKRRLFSGEMEFSEFQAMSRSALDNAPSLRAELEKKTKQDLLDQMSPFNAARYKNDKKAVVVEAAYNQLIGDLRWAANGDGNTISETYAIGGARQSIEERVAKALDGLTPERYQQFVNKQRADVAKRDAELAATKEALRDPQTLEQFKTFLKYRSLDKLTPEQRARYEDLIAASNLDKRDQAREVKAATAVTPTASGDIIKTKHTKSGEDLFVVQMGDRVDRDTYNQINAHAKKLGGWYSSYKVGGAVPGFQFKDEAKATEFRGWLTGQGAASAAPSAEAAPTEVTDPDQDNSKSKQVETLRTRAKTLRDKAAAALNAERKENTNKRMTEAANARANAESELHFAGLLDAIADGIESGEVTYLRNLANGTQLTELNHALSRSLWNLPPARREALTSQGMIERTEDGRERWSAKATLEMMAEGAQMPGMDYFARNLKDVATKMQGASGFKQAGAKIMALVNAAINRDSKTVSITDPELIAKLKAYTSGVSDYDAKAVKEQIGGYSRLERMGITNHTELRAALRELARLQAGLKKQAVPRDPLAEKMVALKRKLVGNRNAFIDFFPTPESHAADLVALAGIEPGMTVLEPSAGHGMLAEAARAAGAKVDAVELAVDLREILQAKGFGLVGGDFMDTTPAQSYDAVVMNPPFSNDMDIDHVRHAYDHLKPGGRLVAIVSATAGDRQNNKNKAFREWFDGLGGSEQAMPDGAFKASLNPTDVRTKIFVIDKPANEVKPLPSPEGKRVTVATPKGQSVEVQYRVMEAADLVASHDFEGNINHDYPQQLQPRDRSKQTYRVQVGQIAAAPEGARLAASPETDRGAPIVRDGIVESGNGRTIGLKQAYQRGDAGAYRAYLLANATEFGLDAAAIEAMSAPVLVRERLTEMDDQQLRDFVVDSNTDAKMANSATEDARADAGKLTTQMLNMLNIPDGGDVLAAQNHHFLQAFLRAIGENQSNSYVNQSGGWNAEYGKRVKAAIFAYGYDNQRLLDAVTGETDEVGRNMIAALLNNAVAMAQLRQHSPERAKSLANYLAEAVESVVHNKRSGQSLQELAAQGDMLGGGPSTESSLLAQAMASNARSAKAMTEMIGDILAMMNKTPSNDMFGEAVTPITAEEAIRETLRAIDAYNQQRNQTPRPSGDLFGLAAARNDHGTTPSVSGHRDGGATESAADQGLNAPKWAKEPKERHTVAGISFKVPVFDKELQKTFNEAVHRGEGRNFAQEIQTVANRLALDLEADGLLATHNQRVLASQLIESWVEREIDNAKKTMAYGIANPSWMVTGTSGNQFSKRRQKSNLELENERQADHEKAQEAAVKRMRAALKELQSPEAKRAEAFKLAWRDARTILRDLSSYLSQGKTALLAELRKSGAPKLAKLFDTMAESDPARHRSELQSQDQRFKEAGMPGLIALIGERTKAGKMLAELLGEEGQSPSQTPNSLRMSQQRIAAVARREGLSAHDVAEIVFDFRAEYKGARSLDFIVGQTQEDLYGPEGSPEQIGWNDGGYLPSKQQVHLIADSINRRARGKDLHEGGREERGVSGDPVLDNSVRPTLRSGPDAGGARAKAEVVSTLRHEVLGHYGLDTFTPDDKQHLLQKLIDAKNEKWIAPVWQQISGDSVYSKNSDLHQAEEVFAHIAEKALPSRTIQAWRDIKTELSRLLRKIGLVKGPIKEHELDSLIKAISKGIRNGERTRQNIRGDKQVIGKPTKAMTASEVEMVLTGWLKRYQGAGNIKVAVHATQAELEKALGLAAQDGLIRRAAFDDDSGTLHVAADTIANPKRMREILRHEVLAHYGLANVLGDGEYTKLMSRLIASQKDPSMKPVWDWVNTHYADEDIGTKAEEVVAHLAELEQGAWGRGWDRVVAWVTRALRAVGFVPDGITAAETRSLIEGLGKKLQRSGPDDSGPDGGKKFSQEAERPAQKGGIKMSQASTAADAAMEKLNLGPKPDIIDKTKASLNKLRQVDRGVVSSWIDRVIKKANTEVLDALAPIKYAEEAAGITDAADSGYVAARMATGAASTMQATMLYGLPEWNDGVIQRKAGTGEKDALLGIFADLGADLHNWLGWMAGHRAELLMAQGRENLLDANDIAALKGQGKGKEAKFLDAKARWNRLNAATLDLAQEAGLFTKEARAEFESEWYIPFFRESDDGDVIAPFKTKGIANQNSGIKKLKGGEANTNDLLENIFTSTSKLIDASMKNMAAQKTVWNLADTGIIEVIPKPNKMDYQALANGKDRIMVKLEGEDYMIRVEDPDLYRAMTFFDRKPFSAMVNVAAKAKRLLTAGVTASPEFMLRNFLRDSLSSWAISKDGFRPVIDSIKGVKKTLAMDGSTIDVMFSGASFLGGYVNGNDPEAMADTVRKSLRRKGMTPEQIARYEKSIIRNAAQAKGVVANVWEKYNRYGEAFENANREAVYAAAIKAGKSHAQAAFESKDLMDFSMLGASRTMQVMTQLLPFFNARVQGLGKLSRELRDNPREIAKRAGMITAASLALLALNWDDERYEKLPDWDKDANWHFWIGDEEFRIPKPFEIGVLFGTIPERMVRAMGGKDTGAQLGKAIARAVGETFALNPTPQIVKPLVESYFNYDAFRGIPIENAQDLAVQAEARYNEQTSLMMRELGETLGMSPKKLEHLLIGYTGTIGSYVMAAADGLIRAGTPGESASWRADEIPLVKAVYRGSGPAKSTQHMEEFYRMLNEVNQLKRTVDQYRSEGLTDKANELLEEQGGILKSRRSLSRTQQQVRVVRNRIELIQRDRTMTAEEKRRRIDEMLARRNDLVYQAVNKNKANWE